MAPLKIPGKTPARLRHPDTIDALAPPPWKPNCATSHAAAGPRHRVDPLRYPGPPADAMTRLKAVLDTEESAVIQFVRDDRYLWATYTSARWGFVDDLELLLSGDGEGTRVDVRSASRVGIGDRGVNRKRVERLRKKLAGA